MYYMYTCVVSVMAVCILVICVNALGIVSLSDYSVSVACFIIVTVTDICVVIIIHATISIASVAVHITSAFRGITGKSKDCFLDGRKANGNNQVYQEYGSPQPPSES